MSHDALFRKSERNVKIAIPAFVRAPSPRGFYKGNMPGAPTFDWYLTDWMASVGMSQADLQRATGWSKRKASDLCSGEQRFNRDSLNDAADALKVYPFELLLHPADAMALRQLRDSGLQLAASDGGEFPARPHLRSVG